MAIKIINNKDEHGKNVAQPAARRASVPRALSTVRQTFAVFQWIREKSTLKMMKTRREGDMARENHTFCSSRWNQNKRRSTQPQRSRYAVGVYLCYMARDTFNACNGLPTVFLFPPTIILGCVLGGGMCYIPCLPLTVLDQGNIRENLDW